MNKFPFRKAFQFYWQAQTVYSAHSPFVYQFITKVMNDMGKSEDISKIELKRKELLASKEVIPFVEYGAGSSIGSNNGERKVVDIARHSLSGPWQCRILYNLIRQNDLKNILEIGTSLGISTAYFGYANHNAKVISLEGNPSSAYLARKIWQDLSISSVDVRIGEFGSTMHSAIEGLDTIDFAFIDGNHKKDATANYFNILKSKHTSKSIFVVDDIYWSKGMHEAWNEIIKDATVAFSIDLFRMGILFFDHTIMPKQHFKLVPAKFKPWSIGLFG